MATKTLGFRLVLFFAGLLFATSIALLTAMFLAISNHAKSQVNANLDVAVKVFEEVRRGRQSLLLNAASVVTADFGFRGAVASDDRATITSALNNHADRIDAAMMAIVDLDGKVKASTLALDVSARLSMPAAVREQVLSQGAASSMATLGDTIYQLVWTSVDAPLPIAIAAVGFALDAEFANELKQITNLDISFVDNASSIQNPRVTTLSETEDRSQHTSRGYSLYQDQNSNIQVYLTDNINRVLDEFSPLKIQVASIALMALLLALLMGVLIANGLTRPLHHLVTIARDIAKGDYGRRIDIGSSTREVNQLVQAVAAMQHDIQQREDRIGYQASHDMLTGLLNRSRMAEVLDQKVEQKDSFYLVAMSVVNLREINDAFGHAVGDQCLIKVAERLNRSFSVSAHFGAGHYICVGEANLTRAVVETLQQELAIPFPIANIDVVINLNIGLVKFPDQAASSADIIRRVEIAVDAANQAENRIYYYHDGEEEAYITRLLLVEELRKELASDSTSLEMYYQPKLNLQTGKVQRMEALIRWIHPQRGFVPPDKFIPLAEQSGLINRLTEWVIIQVIEQVSRWNDQHCFLQVAINLSAQDIARAELLNIIDYQCKRCDVRPNQLAFEITESEIMRDPKQAIELLGRFRSAGFELAIDDFGTGYSSLSQLKLMPVSELKIDREFVMHLAEEPEDQTIVKSTIDLAHSFDLKLVAEGVEDEASLKLLSAWGCEWAQGYWISRPMPRNQVCDWLKGFQYPQCKDIDKQGGV